MGVVMKLWDKGVELDSIIERFTTGRDTELDPALVEFDILGSIAHARMLASVGLISADDAQLLTGELRRLYSRAAKAGLRIEPGVEDIHSQVELMLTRALGDAGRKIHTGRSRNDQVLLDLKMFMRASIQKIVGSINELAECLLRLSEKYREYLLPGYTHLQIAMPSSFGMWYASYAESLAEDLIPLQSAYRLVNRNPLGSAAGYGTSLPLDRQMTTSLLGFEALNINSMHAQMTRGKCERTLAAALAGVASTLGRMAADICLYLAPNFNFFRLPAELSTGSSIMPHKQNPDVFELLRAHCNRLQSAPMNLTLLSANLNSGYHRDYQLGKEVIMPIFGELEESLRLMLHSMPQLQPRVGIMDDPLYREAFSVELVNEAVARGLPFRAAYQKVAHSMQDDDFSPPTRLHHSHVGSIGNLGNDRVAAALKAETERFRFHDVERCLQQLLQED